MVIPPLSPFRLISIRWFHKLSIVGHPAVVVGRQKSEIFFFQGQQPQSGLILQPQNVAVLQQQQQQSQPGLTVLQQQPGLTVLQQAGNIGHLKPAASTAVLTSSGGGGQSELAGAAAAGNSSGIRGIKFIIPAQGSGGRQVTLPASILSDKHSTIQVYANFLLQLVYYMSGVGEWN